MFVITLIPVRNEAWVMDWCLKRASEFSDYIIVADQQSTDSTREICARYPKVRLIENPFEGHSNKVRWLLLEEARKISGNNLILCIDADETLIPSHVEALKEKIAQGELTEGHFISFDWIQLWNGKEYQRTDGVWNNNKKIAGFIDDRKLEYNKTIVINDHTARAPITPHSPLYDSQSPLLHLQFLYPEESLIKQIWYRCSEFVKNPGRVKKINLTYSVTKTDDLKLDAVPPDWIQKLDLPSRPVSNWRKEQILQWFNQYGIEFFEPLDIWYLPEFKEMFVQKMHREPRIKTYPLILIKINILKNKIKSLF